MFKDLGFSFTAVDGGKKSTDTKDLEVSIEVLSNEVVASGDDVCCKRSVCICILAYVLLTHLFF